MSLAAGEVSEIAQPRPAAGRLFCQARTGPRPGMVSRAGSSFVEKRVVLTNLGTAQK